jgi:hypothetical protein
MLLEVARPIALLLCLLSLCALFHAAFLVPGSLELLVPGPAMHDRIINSLLLLSLSAAICLVSGMIFREYAHRPQPTLSATLPMQLFYWATGTMLLLFALSWYLETNCIFYRDTRWW